MFPQIWHGRHRKIWGESRKWANNFLYFKSIPCHTKVCLPSCSNTIGFLFLVSRIAWGLQWDRGLRIWVWSIWELGFALTVSRNLLLWSSLLRSAIFRLDTKLRLNWSMVTRRSAKQGLPGKLMWLYKSVVELHWVLQLGQVSNEAKGSLSSELMMLQMQLALKWI